MRPLSDDILAEIEREQDRVSRWAFATGAVFGTIFTVMVLGWLA